MTTGGANHITILRALSEGNVRYVVIGQVAATLHGSAIYTYDVDICYDRRSDNIRNLVEVLRKLNARLRVGRSTNGDDLPFQLDERTIEAGGNFTFQTDLGDLDCLAWPAGVGDYDNLIKTAETFDVDGVQVAAASVDDLLLMKRKAGRTKDILSSYELEEIKRIQESGEAK